MKRILLLIFLVSFSLLTACGIFVPSDDYIRGENPTKNSTRRTENSTLALRTQIVEGAADLQGTRYKFGGVSPKTGMDCSGLTNYVFQNAGILLDRTSRDQAKNGVAIKLKEAKAGDLIFFKNASRIFHVALITEYTGDKLYVIHSTSSRGVIKDEILGSSYWKPKIAFVRDVITP